MPKVRTVFSNFTAGEVSPRTVGRMDLSKFYNSCEKLENFYAYLQGGATRRPGTQYIATAMGPSRLIKFEFSATNVYVLELGHKRMRFYRNGAPISATTQKLTPQWNTVPGGTTQDALLTWTNLGFPTWQPSTAYALNAVVIDPNGNLQICVVAGTSNPQSVVDAVGPLNYWGRVINVQTVDGTATWQYLGLPQWQPMTLYLANQAVYTSAGLQQVSAGGGNPSGVGVLTAVPYEVTTPWAIADVPMLKFAQKGDIMYFAHQKYPPYKLQRLGDANWQMLIVNFQPQPTYEPDAIVSTGTLTPAATTGLGVVFTDSTTPFHQGDVNRTIVANNGASRATITQAISPNQVRADIIDPFPPGPIPAGTWSLRGSPWAFMRAQPPTKPVNGIGGVADFIAYMDQINPIPPVQDSFRNSDVGSFIIIEGGVLQITQVVSPSEIRGRVMGQLTPGMFTGTDGINRTLADEPGLWTLEVPTWNAARGYPGAVCFHEDRLIFAGSPAQPQSVWGSVTGDYENFAVGSPDDASISFTINSGLNDSILWMHSTKDLILGTLSSEIRVNGGQTGVSISPTRIDAKKQSTFGCAPIQPIQIVNSIMILQREQRKLRQFTYSFYVDMYEGTDLTILAEHVTFSGIKEMAYQQEPDSVFWCVLNNGGLIGLTYDKGNEVTAWHRHISNDESGLPATFISVCSIPDVVSLSDQIWLLVERFVNGQEVFYIEMMQATCGVDCALRYNGVPTNQISGLGFLQGRTVQAVGDGSVYPSAIIGSDGIYRFPIGTQVSMADIGIGFTATLITMRPDLQNPTQTIQGLKKRFVTAYARLLGTQGVIINGQRVSIRTPQNPMDTAVPEFTEDVHIRNLGYDRNGRIQVQSDEPVPCTVLAIYGQLEIADLD